MPLQKNSGNTGSIPKNIFDTKKLKWYELLLYIPVLLLVGIGGMLSAFVSLIGANISLKVIRNTRYSNFVKLLIVTGITLLYYIIWFVGLSVLVYLL